MKRLPNWVNTPPGGFAYTVPETNKRIGPFTGMVQLMDNLAGHYRAAGYEMPANIRELIEKQICENNPEYCGEQGITVQKILKETRHTFHAAIRCMSTLVSHLAGSGERLTLEQQEKRAQTCAGCEKNQPLQSCSTCNVATLNRLIEKISGAKRTSVHEKLKYCEVCHCGLPAKIAIKHQAIWTHMPASQKAALPETCWIKTEQAEKEATYAP